MPTQLQARGCRDHLSDLHVEPHPQQHRTVTRGVPPPPPALVSGWDGYLACTVPKTLAQVAPEGRWRVDHAGGHKSRSWTTGVTFARISSQGRPGACHTSPSPGPPRSAAKAGGLVSSTLCRRRRGPGPRSCTPGPAAHRADTSHQPASWCSRSAGCRARFADRQLL